MQSLIFPSSKLRTFWPTPLTREAPSRVFPVPLGPRWSSPFPRLSSPRSGSEAEELGQLRRLKRLWKEEGGAGASLFEFRLSFLQAVVGKGEGEGRKNTGPRKPNEHHLSVQIARRAAGKGLRRERGKGRSREAAREGARAPLFQQCGGVARTPASAAGRGLRQWGQRRRRRRGQLCGRLRPGVLDGGVAQAPPSAAGA